MSANGMPGASFQLTTLLKLCPRDTFLDRVRNPRLGFDPRGMMITTAMLSGPFKIEMNAASIGEIINIILSAYRCVEVSQRFAFSAAFSAIARALILEPVSDDLALFIVGHCGMFMEGERAPVKMLHPNPTRVAAVGPADFSEIEEIELMPDSQANISTALRPPPIPGKAASVSSSE